VQRWAEANAGKRDLVEMAKERNSMMFPDDDPIHKFGMRITMRAGSMVIWDQRTPHGGTFIYFYHYLFISIYLL
jgi:hypothetical protein